MMWIASAAWIVMLSAHLAAQPGPAGPPVEAAFRVAYHFDRNALAEAVRVGDAILARTESGNLLRFSLPGPTLDREAAIGPAVACLGSRPEGRVLAGLEDGRIVSVDPETLAFEPLGRVDGRPRWVGSAEGRGILAVTAGSRPVRRGGREFAVPISVVRDLAGGLAAETERPASAFLLDRRGRLWLGGDRGEWGGWCARLDPGGDRPVAILPPIPGEDATWEGVYGFAELRDGRVLAFGGTMHMGVLEGFIARVDGDRPRILSEFRSWEDADRTGPGVGPRFPITHLIETDRDGEVVALSYSDAYRARVGSEVVAGWEAIGSLRIGYRPGRPDAVGVYPAVRSTFLPGGDAGRLLVTTASDGLASLSSGRFEALVLPGQLGVGAVGRILAAAGGPLLLPDDPGEPAWRLRDGAWRRVSLEPRPIADPDWGDWLGHRATVGPGGDLVVVSDGDEPVGRPADFDIRPVRVTARWRDGEPKVLATENAGGGPIDPIAAPDGSIWGVRSGRVTRVGGPAEWSVEWLPFADGAWTPIEAFATPGPAGPAGSDGAKLVGPDGPPWMVLDRTSGCLFHLDPGIGGDPSVRRVGLAAAGPGPRILDAIAIEGGSLLLATDDGLRTLRPGRDRAEPAGLPEVDHPVARLARDGLGRLWLGGAGLTMIDPAGRPVAIDSLPQPGENGITDILADPDRADGVLVGLGRRGAAFVRVEVP